MARASFTLKRYLPINTTVAENSDWRVFNSRPASGASTSGVAPLDGATSFDIIIRASSPKWIVDSIATSTQALFWVGEAGTTQTMFWYLNGADAGAAAGCFETMFYINSQSAVTRSSPVPFVDGTTYWFKYSFDGDALTGTYSYAADQSTEPTSWTTISTTSSTLSNLTSYTGMNTTDMVAVGLYDPDQTLVDNTFNGTIYRAIVRTRAGLTTEYFYYTGASDTWVVPTGVTEIEALLWGAGKGSGQVYGKLSVTGGETLTYRIGGGTNSSAGGWPNGGNGGTNTVDATYALGGGGGTDLKSGTTYLMVAGGSGGPANPSETNYQYGSGADAGSGSTSTYTGTNGTPNGRPGYTLSYGGNGGTQAAAGAAGGPSSGSPVSVAATAGSGMQGGNGCTVNVTGAYAGGGGGGGHYGGGGGGTDPFAPYSYYGNGGGGSSYVETSRVSNYSFARRIFPWYAVGFDPPNQTYDRIPRIITDTTNGTTATEVLGPPTLDWSTTDYDGLLVIRWVD